MRAEAADLGATLEDLEHLLRRPGFVYGDTQLHIERRCEQWQGSEADAFEFMLVIGNQESLSNDLPELERRLYEFARSEGYL